ncbi:MAG: J domain-containing protein [Chitinophagales bacterium]|nr:DnaJ domain-containing protein [Bacteroidota bacterium]MBX7141403.1 J domain-containing protein [Chitinophagales bacterium]
MLPNYFKILEITEDASEMEIKRAYRSKAKEFHPSENKAPDALDKFILVNEAYEILIHKNTHEIYLVDYNSTHDPLKYEVYYYWINKARTRAAQHAGLTMKEFLNSKFYKNTFVNSYPTLIAYLVIGILMLIAPFVTVVMIDVNNVGIVGILAVIFIAWPLGLYFFVQAASGFQMMRKYMH